LGWIIFAQAIMGIAAAIVIPISQALLTYLYPEEKRAQAIGIWATLACTSLGIGPIVGGLILEELGWNWIFLINVPLALISLYPLIKYVPESKSAHNHTKIDFSGLSLLILTIGSLVLAIMQAPEWGWNVLWIGLIFVLSLTLFILSERKSESPIIRPDFFFQRAFLFPTLANFCIVSFVWGDFFLLPYFIQNEHHMTALETGILMLLVTGPVVLFSSTIGKLYNKTGPKLLMGVGFSFFILSSIAQVLFNPESLILPIIAAFCFGIGWVIAWGPSITSAVSSVPRDSAALASAAFSTMQEIGGTLGVTIAGTLFRVGDQFSHGAWFLLVISIIGLLFSMGTIKKSAAT
jgi:MFS family permease